MPGALYAFLAEDHVRLEALLDRAFARAAEVDLSAYEQLREGLLRHIGMEEKIVLPAVARLQGGQPFAHAERLRLDHGAIAALLVPTPTRTIEAALRDILRGHNPLEEGPGGLYLAIERLAGPDELGALLDRLRAAPEVPLNGLSDDPKVYEATRRALARAGYDLPECEIG